MLPQLSPLAHLYAHGDQAVEALVGDFTPEDWQVKDATGHDARWILGHLATVRLRLVAMVGLPPESRDWQAAFGRGTRPEDVPEDLDPRELLRDFHAAHRRVDAHWEQVDAATLAQPLGRTLPDGSDTLGGAVCFLLWHEAYHLGQLGLLRRLAGRPGLA